MAEEGPLVFARDGLPIQNGIKYRRWAAPLMAGQIASVNTKWSNKRVAKKAVRLADALITELDVPPPSP